MKSFSYKPLLLLFAVILLIWIVSGFGTYHFFITWDERGTFGDMFGAINALFSGLAFAGVIYAIFLQRKELELQREELVLTREELKRSATAQTGQLNQMKDAAQLSILSSALNAYCQTVASSSVSNPGGTTQIV